jgi:hypothetical protein
MTWKALTPSHEGAIARGVYRLLNIFMGVALLLSIAIGGVAHAAEQVCMPNVEATATGHADGDSDQERHDSRDVAHHHGGCHGHHNLLPFEERAAAIAPVLEAGGVEFEGALGAAAPPSPDLRPPIA